MRVTGVNGWLFISNFFFEGQKLGYPQKVSISIVNECTAFWHTLWLVPSYKNLTNKLTAFFLSPLPSSPSFERNMVIRAVWKVQFHIYASRVNNSNWILAWPNSSPACCLILYIHPLMLVFQYFLCCVCLPFIIILTSVPDQK